MSRSVRKGPYVQESLLRKVEALKRPGIRFVEIPVMYTSRLGEIKLNPWRDGIQNLAFLFKKRFQR